MNRATVSQGLEAHLNETTTESQTNKRTILQKVTDLYFKPKFFEKSGKIYEAMGIRPFKRKLLKLTSGRRKKELETSGSNYFLGRSTDIESLGKFEKGTRFNESIHSIALAAGLSGLTSTLSADEISIPFLTFYIALTVPQAYVVALQRYNRARVYKIIEKKESK